MEATVILTYREGDTPDRHANLLAVLASLACTPAYEVVIVEQDAFTRLTGALPHQRVRVVFAYNPGPFNKSWGLNIGARGATAPLLVFTDADLIVDGILARSVAYRHSGFQLLKPYRRLIDLTPEETAEVRGGRFDWIPERAADAPANRESVAEVIVLCGGLFLMRADVFANLGGWDERFLGWGGEDDAFSYKVQRMRLSTLELDERPALHLWHPRAMIDPALYRDNRELLLRYRAYDETELQRLIEVQRQLMGYREKYRPDE